MLRKIVIAGLALFAAVWAWNTSLFATVPENGQVKLLSHRGVHQTFSHVGLRDDTCTAERIHAPNHSYSENTLPSMQAAFDSGASVVELDVHLTPDNRFAVFHDWTLNCRTDGDGVTEETEMARLKQLDIGYGYTADGGRSYPFRGKGVGLMPALDEVLRHFPDRKFLVNFKSQKPEEGRAFAALLAENPASRDAIFGVYGGGIPTRESLRLIPDLRGYEKEQIVSCLGQYLAYGWTGIVPGPCRDAFVIVPANYAWMFWGWPHRFMERMRAAGSEVIFMGPYESGGFNSGIDEVEQFDLIPANFDGYVWTNRIETIGPALAAN